MAAGKSSGKAKPRAKTRAKTTTINSPGKKPISFRPGGLHQSTGTPAGKPIPAAKMQAALNGTLGPKAQKQAQFAKNVLTGPKKTRRASRGRTGK